MSFVQSKGADTKSSFFSPRRWKAVAWITLWTVIFSAVLLFGSVVWYMRHYASMDAHLFSLYLRG